MTFVTEIEFEGNVYQATVYSLYSNDDGIHPETIFLVGTVAKFVDNENIIEGDFHLIYTVKAKTYTVHSKNVNDKLYVEILKELDKHYGDSWGATVN